jgi:hypothetical protein
MPIIEFTSFSNSVKVCAVDERTGTEAIVIVPTKTPRKEMESLALRKLKYMLDKRKKYLKEDNDGDIIV